MSEVVGEGVIRITTDESGVDVDGAGKRAGQGYTKGFSGGIKGIAAAIGGVLVAGKALDFIKGGVADAREAQKVTAATGAIIKATGGAANLSAQQIGDMATALSIKNGVDDAAIQKGQNLLLTFKNVRREGEGVNDIFGRATQAGLDLAAAGFGSVSGNALQLGKALNDPLKGITALGRSGVTFTAQQKEQIAGFVEANDLLSAQKIILGEVEAQVGGTGEATATNGERAANAWGELRESIGAKLIPVLDKVAGIFVDNIAPAIDDVLNGTSALTPVFDAIGSAVGFVSGQLVSAFSGEGAGGGALSGFMDTVRSVAATVLPLLQSAFSQLAPVVMEVFGAIGDALGEVLPVMQDTFVNKLLPALQSVMGYITENVVPIFVQVAGIIADQVIPIIADLARFFYETLYPAVIDIVSAVAEKLQPVFDTLVRVFQDSVLPAISDLLAKFQEWQPTIQRVIEVVVKVIGKVLEFAAAILAKLLPPLIEFVGYVIEHVVPVIVNIVEAFADFVGFIKRDVFPIILKIGSILLKMAGFGIDAFTFLLDAAFGAFEGILTAADKGLSWIPGLGGKIHDAKESFSGFRDSVVGALEGLSQKTKDAARELDELAKPRETTFTTVYIERRKEANEERLGTAHLARGSTGTPTGRVTLVGEYGPERVYLPRGSRVLTAAETRQQDRSAAGGVIDYDQLARTLAEVLGQNPTIQVVMPTGDPEAAAMAMLNRLVTA